MSHQSALGSPWKLGLVYAVCATLACSVFTGCAHEPREYATLDPSGEVEPRAVLMPGDEIEVKFFYTPELDAGQVVRRDGKISLLFAGDVQVAGFTPAEVEEKLKTVYAQHVVDPEISVLLRMEWTRRVYVSGEVRRPGPVPLRASLSVMEAILEAGGPRLNAAELANVLVIRHKSGKRLVGSLDLRSSFGLEDIPPGEEIEPFYLRPGDIVYVPETSIVRADRWVSQHINKILPDLDIFAKVKTGTTELGYDSGGN